MTRRLIVGVDGSRAASAAVDRAIAMTRQEGEWQIVLVCTHDRLPDFSGPYETTRRRAQHELWLKEWAATVAEDMKQAVLRVELAGVEPLPICTPEYPPDLIQRVARELDADAIVVPDDRSSPFLDLILGSLARQLLRDADIPVIVVSSEEPAWLRR